MTLHSARTRKRVSLPTALVLAVMLACTPAGTHGAPGTDAVPDAGAADAGVADAGSMVPQDCPAVAGGAVEGRLGDPGDHVSVPTRRVVLMGGAAEVDAASGTFVAAAGGGDVLVVRATGSVDSYTPYFFSELGAAPAPASVSTVRIPDRAASADPGVQCRVRGAEALWMAGGDQADYFGWEIALHTALSGVHARGAAVGGTSAGAMALGSPAFTAALGSVSPSQALADPLGPAVTLAVSAFAAPEMAGVVVDTHFTARQREGRLLAFLARALANSAAAEVRGLGLDEQVALTVENDRFVVTAGTPEARVFVYRMLASSWGGAAGPLNATGIVRVTLLPGNGGAWPLVFEAYAAEVLDVVDGVVMTR